MDKTVSQYHEKNFLSPLQQKVADYYDDHPNCSRLDCAKEIYGNSDPFSMQNLSNIECSLRKKGYLYYSVNYKIIDMEKDDVDIDLKLIVQKRIGQNMIGYLKSNIRLVQCATDDRQLQLAKSQFKESLLHLVDAKFIKGSEINIPEINNNQLLLL
jgi:hypothetical protein